MNGWSGRSLPFKEWHVVVAFFAIVTFLLTWPHLIQPDRIYLTAPPEYYFFQRQEEWGVQWFLGHDRFGKEWVDHLGHMAYVDEGAARLRRGEWPLQVDPGYLVPPTYVLIGAVLTGFIPLPTVVFHNLFFVGSVFLAGTFTFLLVQDVIDEPEVALLAGALYMSSFYVFNTYALGHTNQWQIQWIPLVLYSAERLRTQVSPRTVTLLVAALTLQTLSSEQYAVYLSFFLPFYITSRYWFGARAYRLLSFWKGFGAAVTLASIILAPYLVTRLTMAKTGATPVRSLEANMNTWYVIEKSNISGVLFAADAPLQFLFRSVLVVLGTSAVAVLASDIRKRFLPFGLLFGVSIVLAWGPFASWAPYTLLYEYWPLVEYFRVPYRTLPFALLGSSTLSASVLLHVSGSGNEWSRRRLAVIGLLVGLQVGLVHYSLQFSGHGI